MRVVGVYRDEVYNPDTADKGIAELLVLKNMHGQIGTVKIASRMEFPTFDDLDWRRQATALPRQQALDPHYTDREAERFLS